MPQKRELWEVWKRGACWMVQGPAARVAFFSRKTAREVSRRNKEIAAEIAAAKLATASTEKGGR